MITPLEFNPNHGLISLKRIRDEGTVQDALVTSSSFSGERSTLPVSGRRSSIGRHSGRGRGRGDHRGRGDERSGEWGKKMGCVFVRSDHDSPLPSSLVHKYCMDWFTVGKICAKPYGMCSKKHCKFDFMPEDEKRQVIGHVMAANGVWFNAKAVRRLPEEHAWKLGDEKGHGTRPGKP